MYGCPVGRPGKPMHTTLEPSINFDTTEACAKNVAFRGFLVAHYIWDHYCMDFVDRTM